MDFKPVTDLSPQELPDGFSTSDPHGKKSAQDQQDAVARKHGVLEQALTPEALARLGRIKLVKPEKAEKIENVIVSMAMSGKLPGPINEGKLIEMLERGNRKEQREDSKISFQRKRYAFDSDDEDDDEDEL